MPTTHAERTRQNRVQSAHKARQAMIDRHSHQLVRDVMNEVEEKMWNEPGEVVYKAIVMEFFLKAMVGRGVFPKSPERL